MFSYVRLSPKPRDWHEYSEFSSSIPHSHAALRLSCSFPSCHRSEFQMVGPASFLLVSTGRHVPLFSWKKSNQKVFWYCCCVETNLLNMCEWSMKTATEWPCNAFHLSTNNTVWKICVFPWWIMWWCQTLAFRYESINFFPWTVTDGARLTGKTRPWLWWVGFFTFQACLAALVIGFFLYYRNLIYYWNYTVPRLGLETLHPGLIRGAERRYEMIPDEHTHIYIYLYG